MNSISTFFSDAVVSAFGWTLIHSLWQGTALLLISFAVSYFIRNKTAHVRYLAGIGFLLALVISSIATFFHYYLKYSSHTGTVRLQNSQLQHFNDIAGPARELPFMLQMQLWLTAHLHELVICWVIGAGILLIRFLGGWVFTERLRINSRLVNDREWRTRLGVITAKMNIAKSVEFKETAKILTPMVIGTLRPAILIPIGFLTGFSTAQVEAILAHELAHIKRNDYLVNMLQSFVEVIFFFHPAVWLLSDRVRAEREHCCDDIAVSVCGDKLSLAHALVKVAEWQSSPRLAMAFASKKPLLLNRVQRVLGIVPKTTRTIGSLPAILFIVSLALGVSVYAVAQKSQKVQEKKAAKATPKKLGKTKAAANHPEMHEIEAIDLDMEAEAEASMEMDLDQDMHFEIDEDSLERKMSVIHSRMRALQSEMEPLHHRMEEINLDVEKQQFEVERVSRELQKIEWKKGQALEIRSELMDKRGALLEQNENSAQSKTSEADIEKQLADFEQKIKVQEQIISEMNAQISASRKAEQAAEAPIRKMEAEMEELNVKIESISSKMGLEALSIEKLEVSNRPRNVKVARSASSVHPLPPLAPPPPPARAAKPAKPAAAAAPAAPPAPPAPPAKKAQK